MTLGRGKKRYPDIRVLMRIIKELQEQGELYPTNLAGSSNVSYSLLRSCLEVLRKHGLVAVTREEGGHNIVRITKTGVDILANYQMNFRKLLKD